MDTEQGHSELDRLLYAHGVAVSGAVLDRLAEVSTERWRRVGAEAGLDVVRVVNELLRAIEQPRFTPGEDTEFWLSETGQIFAGAYFNALGGDLIDPTPAAELLFEGRESSRDTRISALKYHIRKGRLAAYPKPEWAKERSTAYKRVTRGSAALVLWGVLSSEVERLRAGIMAKAEPERA